MPVTTVPYTTADAFAHAQLAYCKETLSPGKPTISDSNSTKQAVVWKVTLDMRQDFLLDGLSVLEASVRLVESSRNQWTDTQVVDTLWNEGDVVDRVTSNLFMHTRIFIDCVLKALSPGWCLSIEAQVVAKGQGARMDHLIKLVYDENEDRENVFDQKNASRFNRKCLVIVEEKRPGFVRPHEWVEFAASTLPQSDGEVKPNPLAANDAKDLLPAVHAHLPQVLKYGHNVTCGRVLLISYGQAVALRWHGALKARAGYTAIQGMTVSLESQRICLVALILEALVDMKWITVKEQVLAPGDELLACMRNYKAPGSSV
ncbi:hypothetical protein GLOTRDRAFT_132199 [Gloeophyllum trabeum ATCC 11539]|uniref:Uncharacterized protein n=1 Tax=Gloeophyllum trabeum (strain ATCC 11539 / FP-39264 / Madison 617) TaxID=670483 RepID=S7PXP6_GLOTA|nr:uncharacterized protein GLOTRDRAFT_132199 [Gloeophyllum trabeum ATCC 11539]EPQ52077.1 hypothetical protein GLOTRDRAFT_132199 [Gloeophyllum trabeum ATCC 11539]